MKYLIVFAVLALAFWIWRKNREARSSHSDRSKPMAKNSPTRSETPQLMVTCASCGVHLPQAEAIKGARAAYCSEAHRRKEEA
ncbi:MAG: PP0621 family protein [Brachymonas sp.]